MWYTNQQVVSYELRVNILMSCIYCTGNELRVILIAWVTSYFLHTGYELMFIARVTSLRVNFCIELRVNVYCSSHELLLLHELRVIVYFTSYELLFIARVTSYILTLSYNKHKDDEAVYDNKVMIKNYSLRSFFDKEVMVC